ncbi:SusC/RagA family TonB-linked outer membrane protein [Pelobium manganitolerans]|uniref:SusC/RagA family TonB-linked outer membrane protein n=1 Tax=Pelobium manganitolerans TaxID=1842495 RepID=A0A419S2I6_9SPHI|nr:SusC/RagA family TonB-linked outer membrane protein [Pelobium manganitolerans]RKD12832.1 SusC/RagA family TonB-linked outer membrane protein [Pelobium manganitolerans]
MHISKKSVKALWVPSLMLLLSATPTIAQTPKNQKTNTSQTDKKGIKISGEVKDAISGKPLTGINITVPGFSAAITGDNGKFTVHVPDLRGSIIVSGANYQQKEVALKGQSSVSVRLYDESFNSVYDLAVLPFGPELKNHIPYAVNTVNVNGAYHKSNETPDTYLQGSFAGLNVQRKSGTPDIGANMYLRGYNSIYATNQPLIVVDGVIFDNNAYGASLIEGHQNNPLANLDVKDINNITLIKDGTSMYGTRGGNGVLLITTNKAKDAATRLDFSASGGININPKNLPVMNAADYRIYLSEILKSQGLSDAQIQAKPYMDDNANPDFYTYHNNTNWQNQVRESGTSQNYYLKVTGGDDIATYALSLGYTDNDGVVKNNNLTRYQTRFNADLNLSKKIKAFTNLAFSRSEQDLNHQGLGSKKAPVFLSLIKSPFLSPNEMSETGIASPNLSDIDIFGFSNPAATVSNSLIAKSASYRFNGSVGANYAISPKFTLNTILGITFNKVRENSFLPSVGIASDTLSTAVGYNQTAAAIQRLFSVYNDTWLNFKHAFNGSQKIDANIGFRYNSSKSEYDTGLSYNTASDDFVTLNSGQNTLRTIGGSLGQWNWLNTYLNLKYSAYSKYFLSANLSVDGSSRFGQKIPDVLSLGNYRYAVLPSVAGAWLISSENFMANNKFVETLKLRLSYGLNGNDDIGNYTAKTYYVSQNFLGRQGLVRGNIGNPELKWETIAKFNAGLDASFLKERLSLSFDFYHNNITDMIIYEPTLTATGFDYAITNNGAMQNSGVELGISARAINKQDFKWDLGVNLAHNKNEINTLPGNADLMTNFGGATILTRVGQPANLFYGYKTNGVYATDAEAAGTGLMNKTAEGALVPFKGGDVRFVNTNNDNVIDEQDRQIIGDANPDLFGSFSNTLSYKRFTLNALFTFSIGNDIYNGLRANLESLSGYENQTPNVNNRWRNNGQVTDVPAARFGDPMQNSRFSDRWIEDGSYLRLRSLSLSYNIPTKSNFIRSATVYAIANNIFTATKYLGYDPEFNANESVFARGVDLGMNPLYQSMQLGVRIGL